MTRRVLLLLVGAALVTFSAGWLAATKFESPTQRQARARPPTAQPIVVRVTAGTLADEITTRADVRRRTRERLTPAAVPSRGVVTAAFVARGGQVRSGNALVAINGRPLFVLPGRFSYYRDLVAGMAGPDVAQLQAGLSDTGFAIDPGEHGTFGSTTAAAVRGMYAAADASVPTRAGAASLGAGKRASKPGRVPAKPSRLVTVPLTEIVVARELPARVVFTPSVGHRLEPDATAATLTSGDLRAYASVAASVAGRVARGMRVRLVSDRGTSAAGRIVSARRSTGSAGDTGLSVMIAATGRPLPSSWNGEDVLARITISLASRRSLIVPTRALAQDAGGDAYVMKRMSDGTLERVRVRPVASLAGRSAVAPLVAGSLSAADVVRVG